MVLTVHRWFANKSCPGNWLYSRLGDLASKVTAALGGSASTTNTTAAVIYRVRKSWADSKSQKGAYKILANAKKCADANPGYSVYDNDGKVVYSPADATAATPFLVKVTIPDLNIRCGPGTNYAATGNYTGAGIFTITEVKDGEGSDSGWGKLKSGAGWVCLDY